MHELLCLVRSVQIPNALLERLSTMKGWRSVRVDRLAKLWASYLKSNITKCGDWDVSALKANSFGRLIAFV